MDQLTRETDSLSVSDQPAATMPELPPGRTLLDRKMTVEETYEELKKHPMFMTELPDGEESEELAALQALAYEGTPLENASNFKEQGNECFKEKRWADAKEFYAKGVAILEKARRERQPPKPTKYTTKAIVPSSSTTSSQTKPPSKPETGEPPTPEEQLEEEQDLLETLYLNRAAAHLSLRNYRSVTLDCASALRLNPKNIKAFYRSGRALLSLDKITEADDACARGLELDPNNASLKALADDIIKKHSALTEKQQKEQQRLEREKRRKLLLRAALQARNIRTRKTDKPPEVEEVKVRLVPDPDSPESSLAFPVVLLYPMHMESDFIESFHETETLDDHLGYVLPLPWDAKGEYGTGAGVECFMETSTGGLVKVGKKMPLLKVLSGTKVEVVDELLKVFILPKGEAEAWVREWKAKKAEQK
ncbi:Tetratricopeptide repeat protein 4 [Diplogelasinospora grovesii]|uniref:Tetratricopeptide repeat protein 4 n=1 Tax=Diplogelasinospora grovesii TaxID=303347 RepID=A0AAN6N5Z3_9PEZI|nr:Tetratricopeptide repeat protein 4 [Diplogelasinospora grovesii]